jgi:large subunit ribosomal protein L21
MESEQMFAVLRTGGKQYRVEPGMLLNIEKIDGTVGEEISIDDVLLVANGTETTVGKPLVSGAKVHLEIVEQKQGPKQIIFKKRRRQGSRLKKGHRQPLTRVRIKDIVMSEGGSNGS